MDGAARNAVRSRRSFAQWRGPLLIAFLSACLACGPTPTPRDAREVTVIDNSRTPSTPAVVSTTEPSAVAAPRAPSPSDEPSELTDREQKEWRAYLSELLSPCPEVAVPLGQCVEEKRSCAACEPAARMLRKAVRSGQTGEQVRRAYRAAFDPSAVKALPVDGSPTQGPDNAPVTIVEFADMECPSCGAMAPKLEALVAARKGQVRLVYKVVNLRHHTRAEPASRAALAAREQGKFWEMAQKIFANQATLDGSDLERFARELQLDLRRFKADGNAPKVTARIDRDRKLFDAIGADHTPAIYMNGREVDATLGELDDWVSLGLTMKGIP